MDNYKKIFPEISLINNEEEENYLQDNCGCFQPPCKVDEKNKKKKKKHAKEFFTFNGILFGIVIILGLLSHLLPMNKKEILKNGLIRNHILPLAYFCIFSIFFGGILLVGLNKLKPFLLFYFSNKFLDVAFIASYTAILSLVIAIFIKNIIGKSLGFNIIASPAHDVFGFTLGRIILLILVSIGLLGN